MNTGKGLCGLVAAALLCALAPATLQAAQTTIRMWTFFNPEGTTVREKALAKVIANFEAKNPDIRVRTEQQVWDQMTQKFLAASRAGKAPDVIWVNSDLLGTVIQANALADISGAFTPEDMKDLDNELVRSASDGGKVYGVGQSYMIFGLIARNKFLQEAGVDPEAIRTWDDLDAAAKKLTVGSGNDVRRWGLCQDLGMTKIDPGILLAHLLTGEGAPAFDKTGRAHWSDARGVAGIQRTARLIEAGSSPREGLNWTNDEMYDQFSAGRCAMITGASVRISGLQQATGDEDIIFIPYPSDTPGMPSRQAMSNWTTSVWEGSKNKDAAAKLVASMVSPEADEVWVTTGGTLPARTSTAAGLTDFLGQKSHRFMAAATEYIRTSGWVPPFGADISGYRDDMNRAIQQVVMNGAAPEKALQEAEQAYNARHGY
ncbi:multiple sugar transport system substrate-binding protein [Pseudochelatococcus lubricantis]|uniref:Multiple sugar transport system substrate-binding protein n=1 Tax=Pseudochelatococcus lubricantis TaxID=1538102 RepID=A0ABX0V0W2_9HYPH|nr:sugar ABC transporter substrate-binding protein [Pseudochelatococcus lubricantis]NIJ58826.1 multiple sugar transport system substrate-binding protein [Pseudochelatococcus lubricantis]